MKILTALENMKKAQLQTYFQHWKTGSEMETARGKLVTHLRSNMTNPVAINQRFDALRTAEKGFVRGLLMLKKYSGCVKDILKQPPARRIETYELEGVVKGLKEKGFLLKGEQKNGTRRRIDFFTIPEEIAEVLQCSVDLEKRGAGQFLSLKEAGNTNNNNTVDIDELLDIEKVKNRINSIEDPVLQTVFWDAINDFGGIFLCSEWRRQNGNGQFDNSSWRKKLEEKQLGTTGFLNLNPFGIELEENAFCVYQEIVSVFGIAKAREEKIENDTEMSVGADLILDLSRLLQIVYIEPLDLTSEGFLYKRKAEKLKKQFVLSSYEHLFEGRFLRHLVDLAQRLGLVEKRENKLCAKEIESRKWEKKSVLERQKKIFRIFLEERGREHYSFHQKYLRMIFIEMLMREKPTEWLAATPFIKSVVSTFLLSMGKLKINRLFKEKANNNAGNEALLVSIERLNFDLCYWLIQRLALSGILDLGYCKEHLKSIALSSLGAEVLGCQVSGAEGTGALLVNPDFEILQLPEGKDYAENSLFLSSFAERVGSERVKQYHLTRQSVKRFILSGRNIDEVINFLNAQAKEKVPENVIYTLREWSEGVELIHRQSAVVLRGQTKDGMDRIEAVLSDEKIKHERVNPEMVLLHKTISEKKFLKCRNRLKEEGLYID